MRFILCRTGYDSSKRKDNTVLKLILCPIHEKDSVAVPCGKNNDYSYGEGWLTYGLSYTRL